MGLSMQFTSRIYLTKWLTDWLTNWVALEPKGSSSHFQEPATGPYPEPVESTPTLANLPKNHSDPILPSATRSSEWSLSFRFPTRTFYTFFFSLMRVSCPALLNLLEFLHPQKTWTSCIHIFKMAVRSGERTFPFFRDTPPHHCNPRLLTPRLHH
jgi:hypothetical protein